MIEHALYISSVWLQEEKTNYILYNTVQVVATTLEVLIVI